MPYDLAAICELVATAFSDEELRTLCFDYYRPYTNSSPPDRARPDRVLTLVEYADRHGLLAEFLAHVKTANPYRYARFDHRLSAAEEPPAVLKDLPGQAAGHQPGLFGRGRELALLDEAWADPNRMSSSSWPGAAWARRRW